MSKAHWAIPFVVVAVSGCASAPTTPEQSEAVKGPEKPAQTQTAEKAKPKAKKPAKPEAKATAKIAPKKTTPKKKVVAKAEPTKPKVVAAAPPAVALPPSVFEDASALVPAQPEVVILDTTQSSSDWVSSVNQPDIGAPTYTLASLTDPALIETPASRPVENILPQAALPLSLIHI